MRRRLQLRHAGKALLSCIVAVNLLCFLTLYSLHSETRPPAQAPLPWQTADQGAPKVPEDQGIKGGSLSRDTFDSPCKDITRAPAVPEAEDTWQTVMANGTYVYSAYYDRRPARPLVVILGMSSGKAPSKWCQLWYSRQLVLVPALYDIVPETHDKKYAPSFHTCQIQSTNPPPYAVSLVVNKCDVTTSHLRIHIGSSLLHQSAPPVRSSAVNHLSHDSEESQPFKFQPAMNPNNNMAQTFKYNYTVCVTPFNFNYKDVHQLVEVIEVNRMFGADHFVFYNYDSAPDIEPYLQYYGKQGLVDTLSWDLPVKVNVWPPVRDHIPEIHYFAQLVALNDCVYRSMQNSRYVVLTDVDEVIVPQVEDTWDKMLARVSGSQNFGSWMFQNTFYRMDWEDSGTTDPLAKKYELRTLLKTNREAQIFPPYARSKLILRPQQIIMTGIHFVYKHQDHGVTTLNVEPHDGLLHHYRKGFGGDSQYEVQVDARIMLQYQKSIIDRVKRTYEAVGLDTEL